MTEVLTRTIPFFNYAGMFKAREAEFIQTFRDVGCRGGFILQHELAAFEQHLADFLGARHAIGVGNATDGLNFLLRAADIGAGDEVIISTHTMIATAAAIHFAGAVAVPVECGPDHLIDAASVREAVSPRARAIMPTQLNGRTCDMDALQSVADKYKLLIIEDAAQGLGSRFKGRYAGTFGFGSAISFYPAKVLGCLGDGGAVITDDDIVCERIRQLRDHGRDSKGEIRSWGLNSRLDNLQAAFLDLQFRDYECVMMRRRNLANLYTERLGSLREVVLPPAPDSDSAHFDIYQNYEIEAEQRDELKLYLKDHGIGTLIQWGGQAVHTLKALNFSQHLPYSESLITRLLMLPMNMSLSDSDVHYVCDAIQNFYGR